MVKHPILTLCRTALLSVSFALLGCGSSTVTVDTIKYRSGTAVVESCELDALTRQSLLTDDARKVISDVVLLCLYIRDDVATPLAPADISSVGQTVSDLRKFGYRVQLGVTTGEPFSQTPSKLDALLQNTTRRATLTSSLVSQASLADGILLVPPTLDKTTEPAFRTWVGELSQSITSSKLSLFAPPSTQSPSDIPGGDAINLPAIQSKLARASLMTLDESCCDGSPGPTTSASWISSVVSYAQQTSPTLPMQFAVPLYGTYFGPQGQRQLSYLEAVGLAGDKHIEILRSEAGALHYSYQQPSGERTEVYFDDAHSTIQMLSQIDESVLPSVGILYYGVGGEDPALWSTLREKMK
jgi:spore germination protein YaaH